jgi:hypothetical protein
MNRKSIHLAIIAALVGVLSLAGCKRQEEVAPPQAIAVPQTGAPLPPPPASMQEPAPAAAISGVELGTSTGADNRVAAATTSFRPAETIIAAVSTKTRDASAKLQGRLDVKWISADGRTLKKESRDVTLGGKSVVDFEISQSGGFAPGKYNLVVALDGHDTVEREFEITGKY